MINFDVKNFTLDKNYVIEASAGTGKTYNIVEIVNKLVNDLKQDLHRILIVTYTEKAAGELKSRIREKLNRDDVDIAPIGTIHSFCQNVIKQYGLTANLPLKLNVIDDSALNKFAEIYVRKGTVLKEISSFIDEGEVISIDSIKQTLVEGVKRYYLDSNGNEDDSIISIKDIDEANEIISFINLLSTSATFEDVLMHDAEMEKYYNILVSGTTEKCKEFAAIIKEVYKEKFNYPGSYRKAKSWLKTSDEEEAFDYFKDLKVTLKSLKLDTVVACIYLKDFYLKWQEEKERNKNQTFDDMIRYVREAIIKDDKLKKKLQSVYDIAIIDEFQDTNQKQFDVFKHIFMEDDNHKIIVVGDPKQSIYSFQGADVNVYYNAVEAITSKGLKCVLNKNYRSTADMVTSCNRLFNHYDFAGTKFEDCGYLSYSLGDKEEHKVSFENKETKAFWVASKEDGSKIDKYEFAKIAVEQIIDCCSKDKDGHTKLRIKPKDKDEYKDVSFKDFTILVKVGSEIPPIANALKNAGIPFIKYKDEKLFSGKECAWWIAILEAINTVDFTGKNRKKFKKALFTPFFGRTIQEIKGEYFDKDESEEINSFNLWRQYVLERKWEDLFDDIIVNSRLNETMKSLKEIQSLAIIKQIGNYCVEYLSNGKSLDDLIRNLTNVANGGKSEGDESNGALVEKSTNFDCVQIMTMHASKGLQFPVVIAVGGYKGPYTHGKAFTCHDIDKITNKEKQYLVFDRNDKVVEEETEEAKRLFYVAYTRAQHILILPNYNKFGFDFLGSSLQKLIDNDKDVIRFVYDNKLSYKDLRDMSTKILASKEVEKEAENAKVNQKEVLEDLIKHSYFKSTFKHSYSSLSHGHENKGIDDEEDFENKEGNVEEGLAMFDTHNKVIKANYDENVEPITLSSNYPRGARLGTAIHEVFETTDFTNYENEIDETITHCFLKQGVVIKDEWLIDTKAIVKNVTEADLPIIQGANDTGKTLKLKEIALTNRKDEMEFNYNILDKKLRHYCNGFVDLIFKNGDYYSIVDWKSDTLNEDFEAYNKIDSLAKHVNDCYSIQRVLYSYCLIKWIKMHNNHLTEQEILEKHFGGVYYIFIRGCNANTGNGVYCQTWNSYENLKKSYDEIMKKKIRG